MNRHLPDLLFVPGALLITVGLWMAWPPLALVVAGGLLILASVGIRMYDEDVRDAVKEDD